MPTLHATGPCLRNSALLILVALLGATSLTAQTLVFATAGVQLNQYNLTTGNTTVLTTGLSYPWQSAVDASGQVFTSLYGISNVGVYNGLTGQTVSGSFLNIGANNINGLALSGNTLYVAQAGGTQRISTYDATTGALLSANFIQGVYNPQDIFIDNAGRLYVTTNNSQIDVYSATTGALLTTGLVTGLSAPTGLAVDNAGHLFVANVQGTTVGEYDALTGAAINASLVSGLSSPRDVAVDNAGHLFIASYNVNGYYQVGEYNALTGAAINPALMINGASITSLAVYAVPEPSTWLLLAGGLGLALLGWQRRRRSS
jgi:streptogramin lyase